MTDQLPTGLGAVVEASKPNPHLPSSRQPRVRWVRVAEAHQFPWRHYDPVADHTLRAADDELVDPATLSEGWTPPTPEPLGFGAQVESANEVVLTRYPDGVFPHAWVDASGTSCSWGFVSQPATVLYAGVEDVN